MNFVFFHAGIDERPTILVKSIRKVVPNATIIQCSNQENYRIEGIDELFVISGDSNNLMTLRLKSFSELGLDEPAIYLDTDIILLKKPNIKSMLNGSQIAVCKRSFNKNAPFNTNFKGMDLIEYMDKTIDEVYPYLASFNVTVSSKFWRDCYMNLEKKDKKFHYWYGDQEAMKDVVAKKYFTSSEIAESDVSCLPEFFPEYPNATALHFKGPARKDLMIKWWDQISVRY
jgi:hypothetical protein